MCRSKLALFYFVICGHYLQRKQNCNLDKYITILFIFCTHRMLYRASQSQRGKLSQSAYASD